MVSSRSPSVLLLGLGFIGGHVAGELARRGLSPAVLTRTKPRGEIAELADANRLWLGDCSDPAILEPALDGVTHLVYTAGGLLPSDAERQPDLNETLTLRPLRAVLDAVARRSDVHLTYISSGGTIYGEPEQIPVPESATAQPLNAYGRAHLACEKEIRRRVEAGDLRARVLRCSTVYGEFQEPDRGQGAVVTFLDHVARREPIHLYGGGTTVRDYIYVADVAGAICDLLQLDGGPMTLNLGSGQGTSLTDLLAAVEKELGQEAEIVHRPERSFDVHQIVLDITRVRELTDFVPTPLDVGIARTRSWLRDRALNAI